MFTIMECATKLNMNYIDFCNFLVRIDLFYYTKLNGFSCYKKYTRNKTQYFIIEYYGKHSRATYVTKLGYKYIYNNI